jgi:RimJ/RimL family protein N-acetyltransferase
MDFPPIETSRLVVRPVVAEDIGACHELFQAIGFTDRESGETETRTQCLSWLNWTVQNYRELARRKQPPYGDRAVVVKDNGRFAGLVGLVPLLAPFGQLPSFGRVERAPFSAEVGLFWALLPELRGHGFATEAAHSLLGYARETMKLGRIMAGTAYDNTPSIAVMQRLGMRIEENPYPDPAWFQITGILELNR